MPDSSVHCFSDPDAFAAAVRAASIGLTITGRGVSEGRIVRIDLNQLWMQRLSQSLPMLSHSTLEPGRAVFSFHTDSAHSRHWNGRPVDASRLARYAEGADALHHSAGPLRLAAMSLPVSAIDDVSVMAGQDLSPPGTSQLLQPHVLAMKRLQRLHARIGRMAETQPQIPRTRGAATGMEQAMILALARCLEADAGEDTAAQRRHAAIMGRFYRLLDDNPERAFFVPEICAAICVAERTLRACCEEQLGMGPKRYLLLRRLNLARRMLRDGTPTVNSVTGIATRLGFWELGRFATVYRALFGELPSETLHGPADASAGESGA